ncbi:glycosyltransferase [Sphingorhabdus sp. EL138]|uniref:glycosyltransferase n=1 Tax=Sphingorhabdus sp. EL138 TaxID=2073156 RepID=UPI0025DB49F7|nr:glycosyltransferase [Sphingorhabdus sp. EL138]
MNTLIMHNTLWSKYKAAVFTQLEIIAFESFIDFNFVHIAETEDDRVSLSSVDYESHKYNYELLCSGTIESNWWPKRSFRLIKYLNSKKWNLVLIPGYYRPEYWIALVYCLIKKIKIGLFCDSTKFDSHSSSARLFLKRIFVFFCDGYFAYGRRSSDYLRFLGADSKVIFERCQAAALPGDYSAKNIIRRRQNIRNSTSVFKVIYVGRLSPEKDLLTLLKAWAVVSDKWPSAQLDLFGSGPQDRELKRSVESMGLSAQVRFLGAKEIADIYDAYIAADLLVLPSMREPWGLVVNEALSFGCPVVVSDRCGCVPELVLDGQTGFQFRGGDPVDLAVKIDRALERFYKNGEASRHCTEHMEKFTSVIAAQQILDGCQKLLAGPTPATNR